MLSLTTYRIGVSLGGTSRGFPSLAVPSTPDITGLHITVSRRAGILGMRLTFGWKHALKIDCASDSLPRVALRQQDRGPPAPTQASAPFPYRNQTCLILSAGSHSYLFDTVPEDWIFDWRECFGIWVIAGRGLCRSTALWVAVLFACWGG
jgi:hypothetical protein